MDVAQVADQILKMPLWQRLLILGGVVVLVVFIYIMSFLQPSRAEVTLKQDKLSTLKTELAEKKEVADNLPAFKQEVERLAKELDDALVQLPNKKEIPEILTKISSLGKESGLEFNLFKPRPEVPKGFYAEVPVEVELIGNYHDIAVFFDKVAKLSRIVNITDLKMTEPEERDGKILLKARCLATTFRFLEDKTQG